MWITLLLIGTSVAVAADSTPLCTQWDERFQPLLSQDTIPATVARLLASHTNHGFAADFDEEKQIALLRQPLRASGSLIFIPQQGLYRQLKKPFAQELLITPTALYQRNASGTTDSLPLAKVPVAQSFVDAFLAVFSGSWDTLQTHFQVFFAPAAQSADPSQPSLWRLGLKPLDTTMAQVIACLVLSGEHQHLTTLQIQETNGDITSDHFRATRLIPKTQWADYQSQFNWNN